MMIARQRRAIFSTSVNQQVISQQHDRGTFASDVGSGIHGNTHIRFHQSRCVVDTISDHRHHLAVRPQLSDPLPIGQQFDQFCNYVISLLDPRWIQILILGMFGG